MSTHLAGQLAGERTRGNTSVAGNLRWGLARTCRTGCGRRTDRWAACAHQRRRPPATHAQLPLPSRRQESSTNRSCSLLLPRRQLRTATAGATPARRSHLALLLVANDGSHRGVNLIQTAVLLKHLRGCTGQRGGESSSCREWRRRVAADHASPQPDSMPTPHTRGWRRHGCGAAEGASGGTGAGLTSGGALQRARASQAAGARRNAGGCHIASGWFVWATGERAMSLGAPATETPSSRRRWRAGGDSHKGSQRAGAGGRHGFDGSKA